VTNKFFHLHNNQNMPILFSSANLSQAISEAIGNAGPFLSDGAYTLRYPVLGVLVAAFFKQTLNQSVIASRLADFLLAQGDNLCAPPSSLQSMDDPVGDPFTVESPAEVFYTLQLALTL
jgi:hypothetical protein